MLREIITLVITPFKRRINFKKCNWKLFSNELDHKINDIAPNWKSYDTFTKIVKETARRHIPRGCRTSYVPGLNTESKDIYEKYKESFQNDPFSDETIVLGESLMQHNGQHRREEWQKLIESTDMTHNSK